MNSNDYKNGYNQCAEDILHVLSQFLQSTEDTSDMSMKDMIRLIRQRVLDLSYQKQTEKPNDNKVKDYIHGCR